MTPDETALVLTKASAFDQRTIGESDVMAWHSVLGDIPIGDALEAVSNHYRESTSRLWPADVRRLAAEIDHKRRGRARAAQLAPPPALPSAPADPDRVKALVREVVAALPIVDSDRIRERARLRAARERGRPEPQRRKEKKRLTGKETWPDPQTAEIAQQTTAYLAVGHEPEKVSELLRVSLKWCRRTAREIGPIRPPKPSGACRCTTCTDSRAP